MGKMEHARTVYDTSILLRNEGYTDIRFGQVLSIKKQSVILDISCRLDDRSVAVVCGNAEYTLIKYLELHYDVVLNIPYDIKVIEERADLRGDYNMFNKIQNQFNSIINKKDMENLELIKEINLQQNHIRDLKQMTKELEFVVSEQKEELSQLISEEKIMDFDDDDFIEV